MRSWAAFATSPYLTGVSRLALMADGEHENAITFAVVAVKCDVSRFAPRDNQFAQVRLRPTADQGVLLQDRDGVGYQIDRMRCGAEIGFGKKVANPFQIGERPWRV